MYALRDPVHGLKAGAHMSGRPVDPDEPPAPDEDVAAAVAAWVSSFPAAEPAPAALDTCLYTSTKTSGSSSSGTAGSSSDPRAPATASSSHPQWEAACGPRFGSTMRFSAPFRWSGNRYGELVPMN